MKIVLENATVSTLIAELSKLDGNLAVEVPVEGVDDATSEICIYVDDKSVYISE